MELLNVVPAGAMDFPLYSVPAAANTVASLFAWLVAALAAAVGLWRIRAVGSSTKPPGAGAGSRSSSTLVVMDDKKQMSSPAVHEPRPARAVPVEPASPISEPSSPSKVRFTAYYGGAGADCGDDGVVDGVRKCADRDEDDEGAPVVDDLNETVPRRTPSIRIRSAAPTAVPCWEEREMAVRRRGDLGWYRHLDMAVIDGTVVRLWDGEVTSAVASPRGRRGRAGLGLHLLL